MAKPKTNETESPSKQELDKSPKKVNEVQRKNEKNGLSDAKKVTKKVAKGSKTSKTITGFKLVTIISILVVVISASVVLLMNNGDYVSPNVGKLTEYSILELFERGMKVLLNGGVMHDEGASQGHESEDVSEESTGDRPGHSDFQRSVDEAASEEERAEEADEDASRHDEVSTSVDEDPLLELAKKSVGKNEEQEEEPALQEEIQVESKVKAFAKQENSEEIPEESIFQSREDLKEEIPFPFESKDDKEPGSKSEATTFREKLAQDIEIIEKIGDIRASEFYKLVGDTGRDDYEETININNVLHRRYKIIEGEHEEESEGPYEYYYEGEERVMRGDEVESADVKIETKREQEARNTSGLEEEGGEGESEKVELDMEKVVDQAEEKEQPVSDVLEKDYDSLQSDEANVDEGISKIEMINEDFVVIEESDIHADLKGIYSLDEDSQIVVNEADDPLEEFQQFANRDQAADFAEDQSAVEKKQAIFEKSHLDDEVEGDEGEAPAQHSEERRYSDEVSEELEGEEVVENIKELKDADHPADGNEGGDTNEVEGTKDDDVKSNVEGTIKEVGVTSEGEDTEEDTKDDSAEEVEGVKEVEYTKESDNEEEADDAKEVDDTEEAENTKEVKIKDNVDGAIKEVGASNEDEDTEEDTKDDSAEKTEEAKEVEDTNEIDNAEEVEDTKNVEDTNAVEDTKEIDDAEEVEDTNAVKDIKRGDDTKEIEEDEKEVEDAEEIKYTKEAEYTKMVDDIESTEDVNDIEDAEKNPRLENEKLEKEGVEEGDAEQSNDIFEESISHGNDEAPVAKEKLDHSHDSSQPDSVDDQVKQNDASEMNRSGAEHFSDDGKLSDEIDLKLDEAVKAIEEEIAKNAREAVNHYHAKLLVNINDNLAAFGKARALAAVWKDEGLIPILEDAQDTYAMILSQTPLSRRFSYMTTDEYVKLLEVKREEHEDLIMESLGSLLEMYPDTLNEFNELALKTLEEGRLKTSKVAFQLLLERDPLNHAAQLYFGLLAKITDEDYQLAVDLMLPVVEREDGIEDPRIFLELGDALKRLGRKEEAKHIYAKAVDLGILRSPWQRSIISVPNLVNRVWWSKEELSERNQRLFTELENYWFNIRDEATSAVEEGDLLEPLGQPHVAVESGRVRKIRLFTHGKKNEGACQYLPATCRMIENIPDVSKCQHCEAQIYVIDAKTRLASNISPTNSIIRADLGLSLARDDLITVRGEKRSWKLGQFLFYDPSFDKEWIVGQKEKEEEEEEDMLKNTNNIALSEERRAILSIDFWHPDLSDDWKGSLEDL